MKLNKILFALLTALSLPAMAEAPEPMAPHAFVMPHFAGALMINHGKVVKNAPYSAEIVTEQVQNLTDGNQIVNKSSAMSYRDSTGRTRQEIVDSKGEVRSITIRDPEGDTMILRPRDKTLVRLGAAGEAAREAARKAREEARERIAQLRKEGKLPRAEHKSPDGEEIVIKRVERVLHGPQRDIHENVHIRMKGHELLEGSELGPMMELGPVLAGAFGDRKWSAKATTRELGTREIGGIKAEGKMRSYEIPAGEVGNRNPITVTHETWYSPELQVTVYAKHSDPRTGERSYRLENVKRAEPAAALFTAPADYTDAKKPKEQ